MSGLQARGEDTINGVDVREQGNSLRVATNTPHLVSLGTGRLSTAVTLHPIKQGRVTIGSDPICDIYVVGTGVASVHCRVENSHGVVTLYPTSGSTLLDGLAVDKPTRLSQGSMLTIGRSNYLRFNHPEEAKLMKSVLPAGAAGHVSMAPAQFTMNELCVNTGYRDGRPTVGQIVPEVGRVRPPVPKKPTRERDSDDNSDQESRPKVSSIMAKVSKFEYYAKQQKNYGRSQFYTTNESEISPKVFSSNSLTVNTPAKDVLGGKNMPNYIKNMQEKVIHVTENNSMDPKKCSYQNVSIRNNNRIEDIVRNFDDNSRLPKKVNNDQHVRDNHIYGKINNDSKNERCKQFEHVKSNSELRINNFESSKNNTESKKIREDANYAKLSERNDVNVNNAKVLVMPSPAFDRDPQYSPVFAGFNADRSMEAENRRIRAYQDRIKEEEQKEVETARLEEILNMCAEYERQISSGMPTTPTEKRAHNKIITNGSLPRSVTLTNPNFVQTSEGYYKFETTTNCNSPMSQSLPIQRNLSHYENFTLNEQPSSQPVTPEVTIKHQTTNDSSGQMDEIGIPIFDSPKNYLSSPIMIRKIQNGDPRILKSGSPIGSPYENVYYNRNNSLNLKPKSPTTQSPRSRIKTTFAHKNLPSPQYFVFPTPPPKDNSMKPNFNLQTTPSETKQNNHVSYSNQLSPKSPKEQFNLAESQSTPKSPTEQNVKDLYSNHENMNELFNEKKIQKSGIEKQLSLEEEIPMIDDSNLTDNIEFRVSEIPDKQKDQSVIKNESGERSKDFVEYSNWTKYENDDAKTASKNFVARESERDLEKLIKNKSFDDVKKELMADIPELEEFEQDLIQNKREKALKNITADLKTIDTEAVSIDSVLDENSQELKRKYERLREERKKLLSEIHDIKCKMTEIRSQEDDILRELEMEKALIKGEYDSEIAILNIEQKKRTELLDRSRKIEEDITQLKNKQDTRQKEMRDRVEIATLKVERLPRMSGLLIEKDIKASQATLEELQNAQDILDNETKMFEDLEFQHLENESELLSNREDIYNEISLLTKKIDTQKHRILTLKSEASDNLTSALDETKVLQAEYVRLLNHVEHLTSKVQTIEKELKPVVSKLNDIERTQSPDSAFFTDQTRDKSGEFGYSPQTSDSDDLDISKISEDHKNHVKEKFNSIDRMSQSMIVEIERRVITDIVPINLDSENTNESPTKTSLKEKKGFWERNFDSLKRKKKPKPPEKCEKTDIMSQSLNENMFYNNETIEYDNSFDRFNSLRHSKNKKDKNGGPIKSNSSSKIPTFAALGKIIKKDSFGKKSRENTNITIHQNHDSNDAKEKENTKNRYVKNLKPSTDNKYVKAKSLTPTKTHEEKEHPEDPSPFEKLWKTTLNNNDSKVLHRKSCGDEPNRRISEFQKMTDSGKFPSQDDIDRISKVTMDAPLLSSDTDMNTLGKRTLDSLMEIERKRMEMLEEQGCQVIENEREKIIELKKKAQDETKKLWDQKSREKSLESDTQSVTVNSQATSSSENAPEQSASLPIDIELRYDFTAADDSMQDSVMEDMSNSMFEDSSGLMSASSIEELQIRKSRTESTEDDKRSDDSRPLSHASDFSRDNILSLTGTTRRSRRGVAPYQESQRPLTRYLPVDRDDFDLRRHVESAGHQIDVCPYVTITASSCRGYLHKLGAKFHTWSKRWFVFDRETKTFVYYWDKSEKKPRGGAYFQVIEEVYLDHGNTSKSPSPQTTFIVKTRQRQYYLMAPSGESARIWIDVIFTGAQGYTEYLE